MKTSFITFITLIAGSLATPASIFRRQAGLCASGTPQCCDVDVLGVADLDCSAPLTTPTSIPDFQAICAAEGKIDMCCLIPILEQGLICSKP